MNRRRALIAAQQSNVFPDWFQRCEYIRNTDYRTYIDTGIVPDNETGMKYIFSIHTTSQAGWFLMGCRESSTTNSRFVVGASPSADTAIYTGFNVVYPTGAPYVVDTKFTVFVNYKNERKTYAEGYASSDINDTLSSITRSIWISNANSPSGLRQGMIQVDSYECEITQGSSVIRHYFSGYNRDTGIAGLYDTVTRTFLTSASVNFDKGADV